MDIVTVLCRRDLHNMVLQARSIRLFFDKRELGQVLVICNERSDPLRHEELQRITDELPGVVFIRSEELLPLRGGPLLDACRLARNATRGWYTQQVLKLAASRLVASEFYLILDAKNHFVRPVCTTTFLADDGRALAEIGLVSRMQKEFNRVWRNCLDYFGIDPAIYPGDAIAPQTPFVARKDLVCDLMEDVEARQGAPFTDAILSRMPDLYEFLLLQAFAVHRHGSLHHLYKSLPRSFKTIAKYEVLDDDKFKLAMDHASDDRIVTFAVHWAAEALLSWQQRQRIGDYWQERGLVASPQEAFKLIGWETGA